MEQTKDSFQQLYNAGETLNFFPDIQITDKDVMDAGTIKALVHDTALALKEGNTPAETALSLATSLYFLNTRLVYLNYVIELLARFDRHYAQEFSASYETFRTIKLAQAKMEALFANSRHRWASTHPDVQSAECLLESAFCNLLSAGDMMAGATNKTYAREKLKKSEGLIEEAKVRNSKLV